MVFCFKSVFIFVHFHTVSFTSTFAVIYKCMCVCVCVCVYYYHLSIVSDYDVMLIFFPGLFRFLDRYCQFSRGMFMTTRFFWWFFYACVLVYPFYVTLENTGSVGTLLSLDLFKWPDHLKLRWASISYMPGCLDYFRMNLFWICYHHLTFNIWLKWRIIKTWSL